MNHNIYAIFDSKAQAYLQPFVAANDGLAVRSFTKAAIEPTHDFHIFSGDYTLFRIAQFNEETGLIEPAHTFENLGNAITAMSRYSATEEK